MFEIGDIDAVVPAQAGERADPQEAVFVLCDVEGSVGCEAFSGAEFDETVRRIGVFRFAVCFCADRIGATYKDRRHRHEHIRQAPREDVFTCAGKNWCHDAVYLGVRSAARSTSR